MGTCVCSGDGVRSTRVGPRMIWVLVAAVGVPLWILAGCLVGARWSRRRFKREPGAFAAKLRIASGEVDGLKQSWPHRAFVACWTHDVLVIHRGLALVRTDLLGVSRAIGSIEAADAKRLRCLRADPCTLTLVLDSGASVQLAASADDRDTMVGPFAAVLFVQGDEGAGQTVAGP